ncbi:uncharacterized protein LOC113471221 [Diaphorina citri]|uniref:Uncharacterized protein LOC113471221 n=1 Tax=Diaphorina citri TaxID=121845 RepID=A0A3Q0JBU7_DIACI|nr:uncharacterized protein LOC113471221 [Diaphorina citri]
MWLSNLHLLAPTASVPCKPRRPQALPRPAQALPAPGVPARAPPPGASLRTRPCASIHVS